MTTVVVVKKAGQVAVGTDSLVTFGDTRLPHRFEANEKVFKIDAVGGASFIATAGTVAHFPALRKALAALPKGELKLQRPLLWPTHQCKTHAQTSWARLTHRAANWPAR